MWLDLPYLRQASLSTSRVKQLSDCSLEYTEYAIRYVVISLEKTYFIFLSGTSAFQQDRTLVAVDITMKTLVKVAFVFVFEEEDGSCCI